MGGIDLTRQTPDNMLQCEPGCETGSWPSSSCQQYIKSGSTSEFYLTIIRHCHRATSNLKNNERCELLTVTKYSALARSLTSKVND